MFQSREAVVSSQQRRRLGKRSAVLATGPAAVVRYGSQHPQVPVRHSPPRGSPPGLMLLPAYSGPARARPEGGRCRRTRRMHDPVATTEWRWSESKVSRVVSLVAQASFSHQRDSAAKRQRFAAALLPRLFGNRIPGHTARAPPVRRSSITTTVREQNPRSHYKGATGRVRTGDQRYPVLCRCQLGQYIPTLTSS